MVPVNTTLGSPTTVLMQKVKLFQLKSAQAEECSPLSPRICCEEPAQLTALTTTVTLNYKAARSMLTDASDRFLSRLSMLL